MSERESLFLCFTILTPSQCLEEVARLHKGSEKIQCPKHGCTNNFFLVDLYSKITPELYGALLLALSTNTDIAFLMQGIDNRLKGLSLQFSKGLGAVKNEVRKSSHELVTLLSAIRQDQSETASLSKKTIKTSIEELKAYARSYSRSSNTNPSR